MPGVDWALIFRGARRDLPGTPAAGAAEDPVRRPQRPGARVPRLPAPELRAGRPVRRRRARVFPFHSRRRPCPRLRGRRRPRDRVEPHRARRPDAGPRREARAGIAGIVQPRDQARPHRRQSPHFGGSLLRRPDASPTGGGYGRSGRFPRGRDPGLAVPALPRHHGGHQPRTAPHGRRDQAAARPPGPLQGQPVLLLQRGEHRAGRIPADQSQGALYAAGDPADRRIRPGTPHRRGPLPGALRPPARHLPAGTVLRSGRVPARRGVQPGQPRR